METPKNHQAREVHLPSFVTDELAGVVAGKGPDDLVFTSGRDKAMSNGNFRRYVFEAAAKAAGLAGITPH